MNTIHLAKAWTAIGRILIMWKSDLYLSLCRYYCMDAPTKHGH